MLEEAIKKVVAQKKIKPVDVYGPLKINRVNFYKAIKTSNFNNKSLKKIVKFLGLELSVSLRGKKYGKKKRMF
ncbi:MAG: hypothetical protein A3H76_04770 [Candidatus Lloydbacteria bacterium RIFCSPLOWO2_02_FULL_54_12]|nr:MAG: hypothetical protein A3H76_04770 [Candidatus Lloydbacteria bacterium RIFCSPLOWO2_02_FULL_54_12]